MKNLLIVFTLITTLFGYSQSYDRLNKASELCLLVQGNSFMNDKDADLALDKILSVIGASKRFIMQPCSDIDNAVATSYKGIRYILYDKEFMSQIANKTNNWPQIFILAHEVGHHINGHSIDLVLQAAEVVEPNTLAGMRLQELESDEFAGFVLAKLGATIEQTSEAIKLLSSNSDDTYSTHPNKAKRLNAIKVGYNKARGNLPDTAEKITPIQKAEEYWYRAYEKLLNGESYGAISDYSKAIEISPNYAMAYYGRGLAKFSLKDFSGTISDYSKAIEFNFRYHRVYNGRGLAKINLKDYYGAISDFSKAIEISPNDAEAYFLRAFTKYTISDMQGACQDARNAQQLGRDANELINATCN